ncbi:alpha/beta fold hydrolase [Microbacterium excoecariae]|uniref:alpha/beta fold hydrolase n=1 Tax=Microbacterium excoecariae TaxID=2715210 RepID=UPI0014072540|nr:alpha/beta fold hydrolase [Microbacterium excoecariae]NHI17635.1 alpha/beta hydrolase [Microbacterium excoecariae]
MTTHEFSLRGLRVRDHTLSAPLDWARPDDGRHIDVFAREVIRPGGEDAPVLVFLQGGPGGAGPRPMPGEGWIHEALKTHRVLLLDQRGTGRSSRVEAATIAGMGAEEAADFLRLFRAEQIVADAEHVRRELFGGRPWQTLGQSYGGFLTLSYLSFAPDALEAAYVTGGITSIAPSAEEIYRNTLPRTARKTAEFYRRYPQHVETLPAIVDLVENDTVTLPSGDRLSARRLQTLGIDFGMGPGMERLLWLLDGAILPSGRLSDAFLDGVDQRTQYWGNPLYAVLQEEIYADGAGATRWAAHRIRAEIGGFDADEEVAAGRPVPMTGEMFFPWQFDEVASLRPFRDAAHALHEREDHPELYDRARLAANEVPVAAAMYHDDMFVPIEFALATRDAVPNMHFWVTNEFEHDGIRQDPQVVRRLLDRVIEEGGPRR